MSFYIAQIISILNGLVAVMMIQFKSMKKILIGQIVANLLNATSYFLLDGITGAGICFIAIFQTVIMFLYNIKKITPHRWVVFGFVAIYIGCSAIYYKSPIDILSTAGAVTYAFSVVQIKSSRSRIWYLFNALFWLTYDIFVNAYGNFVLHVIVFISTLIAIWRNDLPKKEIPQHITSK